ncbi:MAG: nucleotidyl transferase AbiEii/AbiGii toxin family protein [Planctomycetota bacterium]|nr:MAG: nucleotidyl transferase AbiEii/AbiGii toxin family protein [Planctomycetota bacterium]
MSGREGHATLRGSPPVKRRRIKDVAASIRQRLLQEAQTSKRPFNELLQYFAMERFLYRLSSSQHSSAFVLKGALMMTAWRVAVTRPTKDIDLLGQVANEVERVVAMIKDVCTQEVEADGLEFDPDSAQGERITEEAEYEGVRVRFRASLGTARVSMQVDVGFGDAVIPKPVLADYPVILELPAPRLRGYTRESSIAEKFHTMARRGLLNSRMRNYFDIWVLSRQFDFQGKVLAKAIGETFVRRGLAVPSSPVALTKEFAEDASKAAQWKGFLRKTKLEHAPQDLVEVVEALADFLGPVAAALGKGQKFDLQWMAPGPWSSS